jgi:hypothetical protein
MSYPLDVEARGLLAEEHTAALLAAARTFDIHPLRRRVGSLLIAVGLRLAPEALPRRRTAGGAAAF